MPPARIPLFPSRALCHPAWWAALFVLALNDHALKSAGVLPGWLTGKLSDFAGLLVAPALMATLVRARSERAVLGCHLIVGAAFALLELSPAAAGIYGGWLGAIGVPHHAWADPTDLLALPMLWVSMRLLTPWMRRDSLALRRAWSIAVRASALALGLASVLATSAHRPVVGTAAGPGQILADVFLHAAPGVDEIGVHLRPLKATASIDCDRALRQPAAALSPELFDGGTHWLQYVGENIPLRPSASRSDSAACHAVMLQIAEATWFGIGSDQMTWAYVVWSGRSVPVKPVPERSAEGEVPQGGLVVRELEDGGLTLDKKGNIAIWPAPPPNF